MAEVKNAPPKTKGKLKSTVVKKDVATEKETTSVLNTKRFVIRRKILGEGKIINFTSEKTGLTYTYDHDAVYEANKEKLENMPCFKKYNTYTATNTVPRFARELADQV